MNGHIGRLHHRYQLMNGSDDSHPVVARLDRVARTHLSAAMTDALARALNDDEGVYILRRVHAQFALHVDDTLPDTQLVERWAGHVAGAIVRAIAGSAPDDGSLMYFESHADYTARFIADLLAGRAWACWYYGPFRVHRRPDLPTTLRAVLQQEIEDGRLSATLHALSQQRTLDALLARMGADALGKEMLRKIWTHHMGSRTQAEPATIRPLFLSALRLAAQLDLWRGSIAQSDPLFYDYLATTPAPVDWRDAQSLTSALLAILRFLADRGVLEWPGEEGHTRLAVHLDQALRTLDWLDTEQLRRTIPMLWEKPAPPEHSLPVRPSTQAPTPRQRDLLADLATVLAATPRAWDTAQLNSAANALRLYSQLIAHAPRWTDDEFVTSTIQLLLDASACLLTSHSWRTAIDSLRRGNLVGAIESLPESHRARAVAPLNAVANWGDAGLNLAETFVGSASAAAPPQPQLIQSMENPRLAQILHAIPPIWHGQVVAALNLLSQWDHPGHLLLAAVARGKLRSWEIDTTGQDASRSAWHLARQLVHSLAEPGGATPSPAPNQNTPPLDGPVGAHLESLLYELPQTGREKLLHVLDALRPVAESDPGQLWLLLQAVPDQPHPPWHSPSFAGENRPVSDPSLGAELLFWEWLHGNSNAAEEQQLPEERMAEVASAEETLAESGAALEKLRKLSDASRTIVHALARQQLQHSALAHAFTQLPEARHAEARNAIRLLWETGEPARDLAGALVRGEIHPDELRPDRHDATPQGTLTSCAGLWLLLRPILDARLPYLAAAETYPNHPSLPGLALLLLALGLRWAGQPSSETRFIDSGLVTLAGLDEPITVEQVSAAWSAVPAAAHYRFQVALLRILAAQRLVQGAQLHLHRVPMGNAHTALIGGDESGSIWLLGAVVADADLADVVSQWREDWREATGHWPTIVAGETVTDTVAGALRPLPNVIRVPAAADDDAPTFDEALHTRYHNGHQTLLAALDAMQHGQLGVPEADLTIALIAISLQRVWTRWLSQFANSSIPYLLENFIRRTGRLFKQVDAIVVGMEPRPLDVILEMAGYTQELENVPWLEPRTIRFRIRAL